MYGFLFSHNPKKQVVEKPSCNSQVIIYKNRNVQAKLGAYCDNHRLWVAVFVVYDKIGMTCFQDILSFTGLHHMLKSWEQNKK